MKNCNNLITLGYGYDKWHNYGIKEPIKADISPEHNSHILLTGMSGSGKSYGELIMFAKLVLATPDSECYFADYKQEDSFGFLRGCLRYFPYKRTIEALDIVYTILQKRQSGEDKSRKPVTLIWDEYVANMLALLSEDKKTSSTVMNRVSEILMLGRSLNVRFLCSCQRPDASVFPTGSRLNYGVIIILGAPIRSIYEMLIPPEYIEQIGERKFKTGEGVLLLQGSELHFIKIPMVQDVNRMQELCIRALS